jgi:chemotaxis protein methyltransferase CheR
MKQEGSETVSALQDKVLHDAAAMDRFLLAATVNVTEMFRDPAFYRAFRDKVTPLLR